MTRLLRAQTHPQHTRARTAAFTRRRTHASAAHLPFAPVPIHPDVFKVSLNQERERNRVDLERLKEFREDIDDIDAKYPKGDVDDMDMVERGLVGGYNKDGYMIK